MMDELQIQRELLDTTRRELEAEREQLRELFRLAPEPFLVTDPAGVIQEANRAAAELLREPEGALAGRALASSCPSRAARRWSAGCWRWRAAASRPSGRRA